MPTTVEMSELVLVRHATTDWNLPGRLNSHTDIPLNGRGRGEAAALARFLRVQYPTAAVWSSPAARAQETAAAVSQGRPGGFRIMEAAKEVDFGCFEGRTREELIGTPAGTLYEAWETGRGVDDVEPLSSAGARARSVVDIMRRESSSPQQILISHGVFVRVFLCVIALDMPATAYRKFVVDNASMTLLRVDGQGFRVALLNATRHLESQCEATQGARQGSLD